MKTLIIYDNNGIIFQQITGKYNLPDGLPFLEMEIPKNKNLVGVDVSKTPHEAMFEDFPPSEIDVLKQRTEDLEVLLTDILMGGF